MTEIVNEIPPPHTTMQYPWDKWEEELKQANPGSSLLICRNDIPKETRLYQKWANLSFRRTCLVYGAERRRMRVALRGNYLYLTFKGDQVEGSG